MITRRSIDEVISIAKVEDIISDFVNLKNSGSNLKGLCPFHNEKTPSFMVSPAKNIYKCFGCGKAGNPTQFIIEHEGYSFPEAIRYIADKYGIKLEETKQSFEDQQEFLHKDSLYLINEYASNYFHNTLLQTDEGKAIGLSYFKSRGYLENIIEKFRLGFALKEKRHFTDLAIKDGYNVDSLKDLGLTSKSDRDFFYDRVMFPIHNLSGKVVAFAGRTLSSDKKVPKYINSPETEIYEKRKILYGLYFAKQAIRKQSECILVEGYTDVITMHQYGIENVVASSGTSLTTGQISLIKRYTNTIKVLYDGDAAGIMAAIRGVDLILQQDMDVKIVVLPDGEDPDSYLKSVGTTDFATYMEEKAEDFIFFKMKKLQEEVGQDPIKKTRMIKDMVESIGKIPDQLKRALYIKECSTALDIKEDILVEETEKVLRKDLKQADLERKRQARHLESEALITTKKVKTGNEYSPVVMDDEYQERDITRLLIAFGSQVYSEEDGQTVAEFIIQNVHDVLGFFDNPIYKNIIEEVVSLVNSGKAFDQQFFTNHLDAEISQLAINIISSPYEYANWEGKQLPLQTQKAPEQNFVNDTMSAVLRIKERKLLRSKKEIENRLLNLEDSDSKEYYILIKGFQQVQQVIAEIQKSLGTVIPAK